MANTTTYYRETHQVSDIHDMTHRGTSKERRKELNIGNIYTNAVECKLCHTIARSRNRHDMVYCKCGAVAVDGGSWYIKVTGDTENMLVITELYTDVMREKLQSFEDFYRDREGEWPGHRFGAIKEYGMIMEVIESYVEQILGEKKDDIST